MNPLSVTESLQMFDLVPLRGTGVQDQLLPLKQYIEICQTGLSVKFRAMLKYADPCILRDANSPHGIHHLWSHGCTMTMYITYTVHIICQDKHL